MFGRQSSFMIAVEGKKLPVKQTLGIAWHCLHFFMRCSCSLTFQKIKQETQFDIKLRLRPLGYENKGWRIMQNRANNCKNRKGSTSSTDISVNILGTLWPYMPRLIHCLLGNSTSGSRRGRRVKSWQPFVPFSSFRRWRGHLCISWDEHVCFMWHC